MKKKKDIVKKQNALNSILDKIQLFAEGGSMLIEDFEYKALLELKIDLEVERRMEEKW